ncbi:MAG: hypothetical protein KJN60_05910, partial [Boseongicola sp.]|nr:hypothetical protein [Boseongicola sp.]
LDIEPLASRKLTLFQALHSGSTLSVHRLKRLAKLASRNATLLEASAHGIKAAIRQVEEASALNSQQFYGPDGERQCMAADAPALKKKM